MKNQYKSSWIIPFILVTFLIAFLSMRKLSDPDIGSHLKAGKWIVQNKAIPEKDTFTYTVNSHDYTDMNWLFQVFVFSIYKIIGYKGLSILGMFSMLGLLVLLLIRNQRKKVPLHISCFVFLFGFLIMETRISLRPEMFTFLFLTLFLIILDDYYYHRRNHLFLLPVIMLFWCNIHGLFILGFALAGAYFVSLMIRDKKIEKSFLLWMIMAVMVCFVNPYFTKVITFPLELFTRFDPNNIFHEHIKELKSFFDLDRFLFKDILFMIFLAFTFICAILTWKKRVFHDFFLLVVFAYLAFVSVRNIALFAIVGMPILCFSLVDISAFIREKVNAVWLKRNLRIFRISGVILMILLPLALIARIIAGSYYADNHEYTKTGIGLDSRQLPEKAAGYLLQNGLNWRIINGISLGGWLSWRLPQPVFIDGRLEVVREDLYQELTESWKLGLADLADKYQADLIIYNYVKYFPWTVQLLGMPDWQLIYIDGLTVIFARTNYPKNLQEIDIDSLFRLYNIPCNLDESSVRRILETEPHASFRAFMEGFWENQDFQSDDLLNLGSFFLQFKNYPVAEKFLLENLRRTDGRNKFIYYALSDIYSAKGDLEKASICYRQILRFDQGNIVATNGLRKFYEEQKRIIQPGMEDPQDQEAKQKFNNANEQYKKGDIPGAMRLYDEAIRLSPDYFKAYNNRGIVKAAALKNFKEAIEDFSRAIQINPDYADAYLGRGTSKLELNDIAGACQDWQKAMTLGNRQAAMLIQRYCPGKK